MTFEYISMLKANCKEISKMNKSKLKKQKEMMHIQGPFGLAKR